MIKLSVFNKNKSSCSYNNYVSIYVLEIEFANLNDGKNCKIFLGLCCQPDPLTVSRTNQTCSSTTRFAPILPSMQ